MCIMCIAYYGYYVYCVLWFATCILKGVYHVYYGLLMSIIIQMSRFRRSLLQPSHTHPLSVQRIAFNLIFQLSTDIQYITCKLNHIFKLCIALENKNRCWINIVDTPRCSEQISHHCKTSSRSPHSSSSSRWGWIKGQLFLSPRLSQLQRDANDYRPQYFFYPS